MKIITTALLIMVSVAVFAAHQYDLGAISSSKNDYMDQSGRYMAFADRGGTMGIQNALHFNQTAYLYVDFSKGGAPSSFGAYLLNGYNVAKEYALVAVGNGFYTAMENGRPVQFQAGDAVGFWITDVNGNRINNTPRLDGGHYETFTGTQIVDGTNYANGFNEFGKFVGSSSYDKMYAESSYVMDVMVGSEAPTGQPLPGILATILIGGSGVFLARMKRKKS